MRRNRISSMTKRKFGKVMMGVIEGLSENIIVYKVNLHLECVNCYFDSVNNKSSGVCKVESGEPNYFTIGRCPVCKGEGVVTVARKKHIKGLVIWSPREDSLNALSYNQSGMEGNTLVEVKTDKCYLELLRDCQYIMLNGAKCRLAKPPFLEGLGKDTITRSIFFTTEKV